MSVRLGTMGGADKQAASEAHLEVSLRPDRTALDLRLAGRERELSRLLALGQAAENRKPGAVLIEGEAGIGKTRLVREVAGVLDSWNVLWATCVHFAGEAVPFAAIAPPLEKWLLAAPASVRTEVLAGLNGLARLMPDLDRPATPSTALLVPQLERAITRISTRGPTLLVVDDLQWADASSLDVISFLLNDMHDQKLVVALTVRDEDLPDGHALRQWISQVLRLPWVSSMELSRLAEESSVAQVELLLEGDAAPPGFALRVHEASQGNPYLTELLVQQAGLVPANATAVSSKALGDALLARWLTAAPDARELSQLVAVAGRPTDLKVIRDVANRVHGQLEPWDDERAAAAVRDAVSVGVLDSVSDPVWFRHPLVAEILPESLPPTMRRLIHAELATTLEAGSSSHPGDIAAHHELAANAEKALEWSLIAARDAGAAQGDPERLQHLQRACRLWMRAHTDEDPGGVGLGLLVRTAQAAMELARYDVAMDHVRQAQRLLTGYPDRSTTCRVLLLEHRIILDTTPARLEMTPALQKAIALVASAPGSAEHASVTSFQSLSFRYTDPPRAKRLANQSLREARTQEEPLALVHALFADAELAASAARALASATECYALAKALQEPYEMSVAAIAVGNAHMLRGDYQAMADAYAQAGAELASAGSPAQARWLLSLAGGANVILGRWEQAREQLRPAIAAAYGGGRETQALVPMVRLSIRAGDLDTARRHLGRARELYGDGYAGTNSFPFAEAELRLAEGNPLASLQLVSEHMTRAASADPRDADEMLVIGARAYGDLASFALARQDWALKDRADRILAKIVSTRTRASAPFRTLNANDLIPPAWGASYLGELARGRQATDQAAKWASALETSQRADLRWEAAIAATRLVQVAIHNRGTKTDLTPLLMDAHERASQLGAMTLVDELAAMAAASRVSLQRDRHLKPFAEGSRENVAAKVLTAREREVLAHVCEGRTNSEIAKILFLSNKTVSVHISNILRKTNTASRAEAAAWLRRTGQQ